MTRRVALLPVPALACIVLAALATGCSKPVEQSAAYQAACHGPPLGSLAKRQQATEQDYVINQRYDCIDKASFAAVAQQKADREAANTPAALAAQDAELAARRERLEAERARLAEQREADERSAAAAAAAVDVREVDANTASEADLARVTTVGPAVAAQIVRARSARPFADWDDLAGRVVGLSAAQTAVYASVSGLTVNGRSLAGAPPDPAMAARLQRQYAQYGTR